MAVIILADIDEREVRDVHTQHCDGRYPTLDKLPRLTSSLAIHVELFMYEMGLRCVTQVS